MGYRSDVAYAIVFETEEVKNDFIDRLPDGLLAQVKEDGLIEKEDRLLYHASSVKWYASRLMSGVLTGYPDVDRHEKLIALSRYLAEGEGMPLVGAFARVGEEDDDLETQYWGDNRNENLPANYELVSIQRFIDISWEEIW